MFDNEIVSTTGSGRGVFILAIARPISVLNGIHNVSTTLSILRHPQGMGVSSRLDKILSRPLMSSAGEY